RDGVVSAFFAGAEDLAAVLLDFESFALASLDLASFALPALLSLDLVSSLASLALASLAFVFSAAATVVVWASAIGPRISPIMASSPHPKAAMSAMRARMVKDLPPSLRVSLSSSFFG